jgi:lipopolysaccharide biosynthesis regulator YciM
MLEALFLLLPVAAWYGWVMGRNSVRKAQRKQSSILAKHYYRGLNFLLSDEPDKAVDTLIKMIDLDSDTVETHIAMGKFFRHRGELDRAIRVHQNLVSKDFLKFITISISVSMLCSSILVFTGTKGKHPGWIILLGIGILTFLSA